MYSVSNVLKNQDDSILYNNEAGFVVSVTKCKRNLAEIWTERV